MKDSQKRNESKIDPKSMVADLEKLMKELEEIADVGLFSHLYCDGLDETNGPEFMFGSGPFASRPDPFGRFDKNVFGGGSLSDLADIFKRGLFDDPSMGIVSSLEDLERILGEKFSQNNAIGGPSKKREEILQSLPPEFQEAYAKLISVWENKKFVMITDDVLELNVIAVSQRLGFLTSENGKLSPIVKLSGVYSAAVSEIGDEKIAALIPEMIEIDDSLKGMKLAQRKRKFTFSSVRDKLEFFELIMNGEISSYYPQLQDKDVFSVKRNDAFTESNGSEPEFILLLNGFAQTDIQFTDKFIKDIFELQEEISRHKKIIEQLRLEFDNASVEIKTARNSVENSVSFIKEYFQKQPIADSKLIAVAVDSQGIPHLIVETSVNTEFSEIPSAMKERVAKDHLSGKAHLSEEQQKALGIDKQIAFIEASKKKEDEILKNL